MEKIPNIIHQPFDESAARVYEQHRGAWYFKPEIAESYESFYEGKYREADVLEKELLRQLLEGYGPVESILEVGCGTTHFTRWFASLGLSAVGADVSPVMLSVAKKLWNGDLVNATSEGLPFRDCSFDIVAFIACVEYMPDLVRVLREARRVARKGVIVALMNKWSLPTFRRIIQVKLGKNPYYETAQFYSLWDFKRTATNAFLSEKVQLRWNCTVFPKWIPLRLARFPFGAFLGIALHFDSHRKRAGER